MATSEQYWARRTKAIVDESEKQEDAVVKELGELYSYATRQLRNDLNAFYGKYADKNGLTIEQAKKKVNKTDAKNFRQDITRLVSKKELTDKEAEQLALLRAKYTVTRLDLLINEMELNLIDIYGDAQITMEEHLKTVTAETYYKTAGMISQYARLPEQEVANIVTFPWSGAEFSDLLWAHKDRLVKSLRKITTTGLIRGDSIQQMSRALRDEVENSTFAAERLIRTETNHVLTEATARGYEDNGLSEYEYNANLDKDTSRTCRKHDGKIYKLSERQVGVNMPPLHPNCRSYITPVTS